MADYGKVIGVGGAGIQAVDHMLACSLQGVAFIVADFDAQAMARSQCENTIRLGGASFQGLSPGLNRHLGEEAAEESQEEIAAALAGAEVVFIVAGMGGSTGSGAAPVIARAAKELGALTIAVVTSPLPMEGKRRLATAQEGIDALRRVTDRLVLIPNSRIWSESEDLDFEGLLHKADEAIYSAVRDIREQIVRQGLVSLDCADEVIE